MLSLCEASGAAAKRAWQATQRAARKTKNKHKYRHHYYHTRECQGRLADNSACREVLPLLYGVPSKDRVPVGTYYAKHHCKMCGKPLCSSEDHFFDGETHNQYSGKAINGWRCKLTCNGKRR